ncbi:DUF1837 domain-containing protein [Clostridium estertheticum]|uniref:DUF1837 domain-containing protein n=1 Tax=Clostridium estertheticum TaxID=238834 RepID=UPI001CF435C9|nr:DUF1837 domain-containing protein [Clostridium estertheticum]MCB2356411.1 DUF1837 domain-containing protein [Clostridium estertheticum]WAG39644.1 DUF1837 domain-containing protein [Clostridium estertheticum]
MVRSLKDIRFQKRKNYSICHIDDFSDDLKNLIKKQLSSVCNGTSKASSDRKAYSYKSTIKEFLKRYNTKPLKTKIGMVGELLTHILILNYFTEFNTVSPYFNLEERSIKKGFDIVLYSTNDNALWITEVKSGQLHKDKSVNETNKDLLRTANRDLERRLNENEVSIWENAINGASIVLDKNKDMKDAVIEILGSISDEIVDENGISNDKNVILVSSLFSSLSDEIKENEVKTTYNTLENKNNFNNLIAFSIQKGTYTKVIEFFKKEAEI